MKKTHCLTSTSVCIECVSQLPLMQRIAMNEAESGKVLAWIVVKADVNVYGYEDLSEYWPEIVAKAREIIGNDSK